MMPEHRAVAISVLTDHVERRPLDPDDCWPGHRCSEALDDLLAEQRARDDAATYDIGVVVGGLASSVPDASWSTAALVRVVRDRLLAPPWHDGAKRNIAITTGLARLGERGLFPDAVVRACLADVYRRGMLMALASMWHSVRVDGSDLESLPHHVLPWVQIIDGDPGVIALGDAPALMDVVACCLTGEIASLTDRWIQEASIAHIVDWRIVEPLRVVIAPEDATVPAGQDASRWLVERFSTTSLRDWGKSSLEWEIAWHQDGDRVAQDVGMSVEHLRERPTDLSSVLSALSHRLRVTAEHDEIAHGLTAMEVVEQIVRTVREGDRSRAGVLARGARDRAPRDRRVLGALAFCTIPDDPVEARKMIFRLLPPGGPERSVHEANLVSTYLVEGSTSEARAALQRLGSTCGGSTGWLWVPDSLALGEEPVLRGYTIRDWVAEAMATIG